jgi:hypothetical protein
MSTSAEVITWRDAAQDPPSDDTTVLVSIMGSSEPVWLGWLDAGVWREVTDGAAITGAVVSWADVPEGWFPGVPA